MGNFFINGANIIGSGNNVVMVNGRIVSGNGMFGNSQKFDEKKSLQADGINRIIVKSDSNVIVTASNTNVIEAHFYGEAIVDGKLTLNIDQNSREVVVTLDIDSNIICNNHLTLTVDIPARMFEMLSGTSHSGELVVKNDVSAKKILLETHNGNVESAGNFVELSATTHNGDIDVYVDAKNNVKIEAHSHNGDVSVDLQNIATSNISMSTKNGNKRNRFCGHKGGYIAYGRAMSHNGNVVIK